MALRGIGEGMMGLDRIKWDGQTGRQRLMGWSIHSLRQEKAIKWSKARAEGRVPFGRDCHGPDIWIVDLNGPDLLGP